MRYWKPEIQNLLPQHPRSYEVGLRNVKLDTIILELYGYIFSQLLNSINPTTVFHTIQLLQLKMFCRLNIEHYYGDTTEVLRLGCITTNGLC